MDFSLPYKALITVMALLISLTFVVMHYAFKPSLKQSNKKRKSSSAVPEPSGVLPIIGHLHLLGGQLPVARILGAMADKYGPIYSLKLGHYRALVLSDWELVKESFTTHDRLFANRPNIAIGKYVLYDSAAFAAAPYGQYWRELRKLATLQLLSAHRIELLQHVRVKEVDSFIKDLFRSEQKVVPLCQNLEQLTFNINTMLIAGKRFSAETMSEKTSEVHRLREAIKEALHLAGVFVWSDVIPWLEFLDVHGHIRSMKRIFKELDLVMSKWLEDHRRARANGGGGGDLMDVMLSDLTEDDAVLGGHSRDTVIKATSLILILTGTESTAVTLTWIISNLLNHPSILKAAQEELDTHVGKHRWVQESDIPNLKYLQAIVKETLRLFPPGPITGAREATQDCYVGGHYVPKGTRLIVNLWKLQRDPRTWSDPLKFLPERFLTTRADLNFRDQNFEYIPFSAGRRSCPGMGLGLAVVQLILARILQGFELGRKDELPVDMREGLGLALPKLTPLEARLTPRLAPQLYESL